MPSVGLKHTQSTDMDYYLGKFDRDTVSADNVNTKETALTVGLNGLWKADSEGKLTLNAGLNFYQILNGKVAYISNYGGYKVNVSEKTSGNRPDVGVKLGANYQVSDNVRIFLNGEYQTGKFRHRKAVNVGLKLDF
ncbi:hypothetical protein A6046_08750 [[Haemophilus] ducreyi]|uniref:Autotransporter domain-containing protein n=2 Tax=Haemophilus ducreyi TaxID=730 RepID=Q7VM98_HAEDU|nr:autotransporter outer membrane beta-barrel domain-containing protein [[Haemophilus] ducreyi]AAP95961.1 hypothetical protein HD_1095 [[Haemophilus] ducreyi 35000HP]AKO30965.1 hypothetical protein RY60_04360 [[Haemophilus] ducreyi]AKO32406.1 hypothetical protein RZ57_04375 [[Haemophilus] ducreyi]AKO33856.1 hypothetical protein RZ58_04385 [[Haemophilus] ducreyi]AKO35304.1 hypothetical protein RZ59_04335 [[Haemophilus] ducreyi]